MKILHVIASVDPSGGGPIEGVVMSSETWRRHGHTRHIVCLDPPHSQWVQTCPVPTFAVGIAGKWHVLLKQLIPLLRYAYSPWLKKWLRAHVHEYDAVIINGLWNYSSFGSWRALGHTDVTYVVFTHGMLDPWFNKTYPIKTFFKTIYWKLFEHRVLRDARAVLFTSEEERRLAQHSFAPYMAREIVVGYGTRDDFGDPATEIAAFFEKAPRARGRRLMLFLSRIHPKKGVDLLIQAFSRLAGEFPEFDLVIAGPDQVGWQATLEKLARQLGVAERIHWPGMLLGDPKWGAFRAAEFFVLPSHQENFGIVVSEAMAIGRPVLVTNKVNIWREIEQDGAGLVVDDNAEAVETAMRTLCSLSAEAAAEMGARARRCFVERYDLDRNAMQLLELLTKLRGET
ncbi:MAG TPA: glycosyltransferase [Methylocystis sp.]|nr:glycosyltransferase [Methylocystis sp.]